MIRCFQEDRRTVYYSIQYYCIYCTCTTYPILIESTDLKGIMSSFNKLSKCLAVVIPQVGKFRLGNNFRMLNTTIARNAIYDVDTEKDFNDKVFNCNKPVIVDFHARYCLQLVVANWTFL